MMRWSVHLGAAVASLLIAACTGTSPGAAPSVSAEKEAPPNTQARSEMANDKRTDPQPIPWKAPGFVTKSPVVVELFTSEGCSSCPSADALLKDLAERKPIDGADIVALELHVDYWNDLGWVDPFSNESFTRRQRAYGNVFGDRSAYTPQMVVDGRVGFVGSNSNAASRAILNAKSLPKATVSIERAHAEGALGIAISNLPPGLKAADVMLAIVEDGLSTRVLRGENGGSTLAHAPIVRSLVRAFSLPADPSDKTFSEKVEFALAPSWNKQHLRAVAFVQDKESLGIFGAGTMAL